ncbi:MAG TPA: ferredoxin--NADP reductase [Mycobacterium sp.]|nr:ferredoxin--NADP reductase [Mycobacterium sp.]
MTPPTPPLLDAAATDADGFASLRIKDVVRETADAVSLVFDVPSAHGARFDYRAGQFLTLRVTIDGQEHRRCYSMSSSPAVGEDLRITVKRDRDGVVSNWLNDNATPGGHVDAAAPEGRFVLTDSDRGLIAFAGGSGITPVLSLIHTALAATTRPAQLFYANRDADSVIFKDALSQLESNYGERFALRHHLDEHHGVVSAETVAEFLAAAGEAEIYICGPGPFMDTVETAVLGAGIPAGRVHLERFSVAATPAGSQTAPEASVTEEVTIELDRQQVTCAYRPGNTILQTARLAGLKAPSSCETGSCGTCMAQVVEGSARMLNNDALEDHEVADGWVVTCQALPTSPRVRVVYE